MLTCIALAGAFYFHIEHSDEVGVRTSGTTWEVLIPVNGTRITRNTEHARSADNNPDEYTVWFHPIDGGTELIYLKQDKFSDWTPIGLLNSCGDGR